MLKPEEAARQIGSKFLKNLLPPGDEWRWNDIRENIRKSGRGLVGTGYEFALIHAFAQQGRELETQLLLEHGVDIHAEDDAGFSVVQHAARSGNRKLIRLLGEKATVMQNSKTGKRTDTESEGNNIIADIQESQTAVTNLEGVTVEEANLERTTVQPTTPKSVYTVTQTESETQETFEVIRELLKLAMRYPDSVSIQRKLRQAYAKKGDYDEAVCGWWSLLEKNPLQLGFLRELRNASSPRHFREHR